MKYDLKKIMKRAWEIKKENVKYIFALCLKKAWEEVKNTVSLVKGKSYTVKNWFANKVANEAKKNISMCDVFAILKETEKAVYAMLNLGCDSRKCMWVPKSVLEVAEVGLDAAEIMHHETIFEEDYNKCVEEFQYFWSCYK